MIKKEAVPYLTYNLGGKGEGERIADGAVFPKIDIHSIENKEITECVISISILMRNLTPVLLGYRSRNPLPTHPIYGIKM